MPLSAQENPFLDASAGVSSAEAFPLSELSLDKLQEIAKRVRRHVVTMTCLAGSGHPGGSLSAVELATALYFKVLRHRPQDPCWPERDRFILSKGHAAPLLYAVLAECGYFPASDLASLRKIHSHLQGHTDRTCTSGVEMSAGSVGQGLSFGIGVALAGRLDGLGYRVYVLMGDGECDEGQVWEAAMAAAHFKVDNLVAIVDRNKLQLSGWTKDIMELEPFADKWRAFGWQVMEVDGHSFPPILQAVEEANRVKGRPTVIIAHTIKGKGVSFMENNPQFHGKVCTPQELEIALKELG